MELLLVILLVLVVLALFAGRGGPVTTVRRSRPRVVEEIVYEERPEVVEEVVDDVPPRRVARRRVIER